MNPVLEFATSMLAPPLLVALFWLVTMDWLERWWGPLYDPRCCGQCAALFKMVEERRSRPKVKERRTRCGRVLFSDELRFPGRP